MQQIYEIYPAYMDYFYFLNEMSHSGIEKNRYFCKN